MVQSKSHGPAPGARQHFHLQFITIPTADTPGTAIILQFEDEKYLFGQISEGLQRACIQRGIGLRKTRNLFLSGSTKWQTHGGLIGLILSLADVQLRIDADNPESAGKERLHIHGPPKLLHTVACARRFVFRTGMPLTIHESKGLGFEWQEEPTWSDHCIRVWSIPIQDGIAGLVPASDENNSRITMTGTDEPETDPKFGCTFTDIEQEQALRRRVVSDMFESDWRRDRLFERPFRDVKMPATVWVRDPSTKDLRGISCLHHGSAPEIGMDQIVLVRDPWPASLVGELPTASNLPENVSLSYIVKGYPQRGTFDPKKAKELGVEPGPSFSELTAGRSVTLGDGRVITPDMVLGPSRQGKGFAFFDIPSKNHLVYLQRLLRTQPPSMLEGVSACIWSLGADVGSASDFQEVLRSLPDIKHIVSDVSKSPNIIAYESVALYSLLTAKIAPTQFPLLAFNNRSPYDSTETSRVIAGSSPLTQPTGISTAKAGAKVSVQPKYSVDESEVQQIFAAENIKDRELAAILEKLQHTQGYASTANLDLAEPEIITLGTGSALPSKYRNVSATLLRMPGDQGNYLFDCGENTLGQLKRIYPASELRDILRNLRAIWISHLHADHHLGTISILLERRKVFEESGLGADRTIYLISEGAMHDFIREYLSVEPNVLSQAGVAPIVSSENSGTTLHGKPFDFNKTVSGLSKVESVRVSHCAGAQAVSMTFRDGFKISYSGDCRPSWKFCEIGLDSDVLIHEATFDNDLDGDAWAKKHSTTAEALGVAINMRAKNVVLTHFSQRYHKVPNFENVKLPDEMQFEEVNAAEDDGPVDDGTAVGALDTTPQHQSSNDAHRNSYLHKPSTSAPPMHIAVAFDYMRFKVSEIASLKDIYPKIQQIFDEQEAEAEKARAAIKMKNEKAQEEKREKHGKPKKNRGGPQKQKPNKQSTDHDSAANGAVIGDVTGENYIQSLGLGTQTEAKQINENSNLSMAETTTAMDRTSTLSKTALKRIARSEARKERERKRLKHEQQGQTPRHGLT